VVALVAAGAVTTIALVATVVTTTVATAAAVVIVVVAVVVAVVVVVVVVVVAVVVAVVVVVVARTKSARSGDQWLVGRTCWTATWSPSFSGMREGLTSKLTRPKLSL
jgi:hypothetical protein